MSWMQYIDSFLIGDKKGTAGALTGHDGTVWAASPSLPVQPQEAKRISDAMANPSIMNDLQMNGFMLAGKKFRFQRFDGESNLQGKLDKSGVSIYKTAMALVIGFYESPISPEESNEASYKCYKFLLDANY